MKIILELVVIGYFAFVKANDLFEDEKADDLLEDETNINYDWAKSYFNNVTSSSKLNSSQSVQNESISTSGKFFLFNFLKIFSVNLFKKF